jgi:hypothetical protein
MSTKKKNGKAPPAELMRREEPAAMPLMPAVDIEALIAKAVEKESPLEVMEKLMAMRQELEREAARKAFFSALGRFQASYGAIKKTKKVFDKNGRHRYSYAPLDAIILQVRSALQEYGLSYTIETRQEDNKVTAVCIAHHSAGHSEKTEFTVPIDPKAFMNDSQKAGSALTYAKRYALCNAFGILTTEGDDDARSNDQDDIEMPEEKSSRPKTSHEIRGYIEEVTVKTGRHKNGKPWTRYGVRIGDQWYGTFSSTLGGKSQELDGLEVAITYEDDGDHKNLTWIQVIEPPPAAAPPAAPEDPPAAAPPAADPAQVSADRIDECKRLEISIKDRKALQKFRDSLKKKHSDLDFTFISPNRIPQIVMVDYIAGMKKLAASGSTTGSGELPF